MRMHGEFFAFTQKTVIGASRTGFGDCTQVGGRIMADEVRKSRTKEIAS